MLIRRVTLHHFCCSPLWFWNFVKEFWEENLDKKNACSLHRSSIYSVSFKKYINISSSPTPTSNGGTLNREMPNQLHGAEFFLRSQQLFRYSRNSQNFIESERSLTCLKELVTGLYAEPYKSSQHPIIFLKDKSSIKV
jgi:hypothetical protein